MILVIQENHIDTIVVITLLESRDIRKTIFLKFFCIEKHRPQKVYEQRGIRGKLYVGRPISREPNIVGC